MADTTDVINSGTYDVDVTDTIQSLSGSGAVELASGITLTTGDSGDDTVSGVFRNRFVRKTGSGTLTFQGRILTQVIQQSQLYFKINRYFSRYNGCN